MAGFICIGALAAFGLVCVLWLFYGLCCGKPEGMLLIISRGEHGLLRRCLWLREMGLLKGQMAAWVPDISAEESAWLESHGIEIWKPSCLAEGYETGAEKHGAGAGDSPGRHQCGGVSEL